VEAKRVDDDGLVRGSASAWADGAAGSRVPGSEVGMARGGGRRRPTVVAEKPPVLLTKVEAGEIFRVHPKTIERWRRLHGFPCVRVGGSLRYDLSDVLRWASARKEGV
jgi:hypothetical protein